MKILIYSYVLILGYFLIACQSDAPETFSASRSSTVDALVVYLHDSLHALSGDYAHEVAKVADYTHLPFAEVPIGNVSQTLQPGTSTRVILLNGTTGLSEDDLTKLTMYVAAGGTVIFTSVNEDQRAGFLSGLLPTASFTYDLESQGIRFSVDLLPGMTGEAIYLSKKNVGLLAENFREGQVVLATSASDPDQPIILMHRIGEGKVIHFNTSMILEKQDRGLLFSTILMGLEGIPYPPVNASAIFIDDFPSPIYEIDAEPISSEMGITQAQFITDVWWPDMLRLKDDLDLTYTAYPCFNYDRIKKPPFLFSEWEQHKTTTDGKQVPTATLLGQQMARKPFELGLHGYNHESLLKEVWPQPENLAASLSTLRKKWTIAQLGSYPVSYVPPSNEIDQYGLEALVAEMPEIAFMCSIFDGELERGGYREFDQDPLVPQLFDFPRITSGYTFDSYSKYIKESAFIYTGIWTHFIHPDDVYQLPVAANTSMGRYAYRNNEGLNWRSSDAGTGMYDALANYLHEHQSLHPFTPYLTVSQAASITRNWRKSDYRYATDDSTFTVNMVSEPWTYPEYHWTIYCPAEYMEIAEKQLNYKQLDYGITPVYGGALFTVKSTEPVFSISLPSIMSVRVTSDLSWLTAELTRYEASKDSADQPYQEAPAGPTERISDNRTPEVIADSVTWLVANEKVDQAITTLEARLLAGSRYDEDAFDQYISYLGWQDQSSNVWPLLDAIYGRSTGLGLQYLDFYLSTESYPSDQQELLWLKRKMNYSPNLSQPERDRLTALIIEEGNQETIEAYLNTEKSDFYASYIRYLLDTDTSRLVHELSDKSPELQPTLWPMATAITYVFSDNGLLQSALMWSDYSEEVAMLDKLQWWVTLEAYNKMTDVYEAHIRTQPNDTLTAYVINVWYDMAEIQKAASLAVQLQDGALKAAFIQRLDEDVPYLAPVDQKYLLRQTPELLSDEKKEVLSRALRIDQNDMIELKSSYVFDNFQQAIWDNSATYHLRNRRLHLHSISALHSYVSDLQLAEFDPSNTDHTLYGLGYRYQTADQATRPVYYVSAGLMKDLKDQLFGQFSAGVSRSTEKVFRSLSLTLDPVKTGPGLSRDIYKAEAVGYFERGANRLHQTSASLVSSYYTTEVYELAFTARHFFNLGLTHRSRFSPYLEGFGSFANGMQEDGNPFWIIEERIYAGGGVAWIYGKNPTKFNSRIEAGVFFDSYTDYFIRVNVHAMYPIAPYTFVTGDIEVFNQALYYSNGFSLGIKHHLRYRNFMSAK